MDQQVKSEIDKVELLIGRVMQVGVSIAAGVIVIGIALWVATGVSGYPSNTHPTRPLAILQGTMALKPYAVLMTGIFLLILTPVLRVVVSIYGFIVEHDHLYTWITTIVLVILMFSMVIGYLGH